MAMNTTLHIETGVRAGRTFLKNAYSTPPLKVADVTEDKNAATLRLMLMSSSPGVLDGDCYEINIEVAAGASLHLETQSYQRLFQMAKGAVQHLEVHLQPGASFCYLPHPVVPHQHSIFSAHNKVFLASGCTLLWGDVLTPGRQLHGEQFTFSTYHSVTEIFQNTKLVVKENMLLQPGITSVAGIGRLEGYTHQATLFYLQERACMKQMRETAVAWLASQPAQLFGISTLPVNGLVVRLLGRSSEPLFYCLKKLAQIFSTTTPVPQESPLHVR